MFNILMFNRFKPATLPVHFYRFLKPVVSKLDDVGRKNVPNVPWNIESKRSLSQFWMFLPPDKSLLHRGCTDWHDATLLTFNVFQR